MRFRRQQDLNRTLRQIPAGLFGQSIEKTREARGLSVQEAAGLAGMESSDWIAIEYGSIPGDPVELRSIAAALEFRYEKIAQLALLCQEASEV